MNASSNIQAVFIVFVGVVLALWLGVSIVTDQTETLLKAGVVGMLLFCVLLGRRIWLLMYFFMALNIPLLRGFSTAQLGMGLFFGFGMLLLLMRRLPMRWVFGELEWWRVAIGLCVLQVYMRNPAGLGMLGTSSVGGKAYFLFALAFGTSFLLSVLRVPAKELKWLVYANFFGNLLGAPVAAIRTRMGLASIEATEVGASETMPEEGKATRIGFLGGIAIPLAKWISSRMNPIRACFHPFWAVVVLFTLGAAAMSGFRNVVVIVGMTYLLGIAYRGGFISVTISLLMLALTIGALSVVNVLAPLPPNIQRALTIFPGTWEEQYKRSAAGSTDWRVEMWKEALFTDRWIDNKLFGDGLGMSKKELERSQALMVNSNQTTHTGISIHQENAMISGDYHSGPVQTVRTVGYFGLAVLLLAMIRVAVHAHRQIQRTRGTEWFPVALYLGIPMISSPFIFAFVFGDFGRSAAAVCMSAGLLRVLQANIPLEPWRKRVRQPVMLPAPRPGRVGARLPQQG